jgi:hypothetical protein
MRVAREVMMFARGVILFARGVMRFAGEVIHIYCGWLYLRKLLFNILLSNFIY